MKVNRVQWIQMANDNNDFLGILRVNTAKQKECSQLIASLPISRVAHFSKQHHYTLYYSDQKMMVILDSFFHTTPIHQSNSTCCPESPLHPPGSKPPAQAMMSYLVFLLPLLLSSCLSSTQIINISLWKTNKLSKGFPSHFQKSKLLLMAHKFLSDLVFGYFSSITSPYSPS